MCEHDDLAGFMQRRRGLDRRAFGRLALGAGALAALPGLAAADGVAGREVEIRTADGTADAYFVHPDAGRHSAVLVWPDIFGLRPAFRRMADRLAEAGYAVLVVNPFYRTQRAPTAPAQADFNDPDTRRALMALRATLTARTAEVDAVAFLAFLDAQAVVDPRRKMGTAGYCMGGPLVFRTAAAVPERVGAAASFHGGGLVTEAADSPHRQVAATRANFLIAIAANDDAKEPAAKDRLREAFAAARREAEIEVYAGTRHGWCPPDSPAHDPDAAEKAWQRLLALLARSL